jgi:hypothetical protein
LFAVLPYRRHEVIDSAFNFSQVNNSVMFHTCK